MVPGRTRRTSSMGMTLIEVMVVLGLVSLMIAASVRGFRSLSRSDVRVTAAKLSGAMKYLFDRASTTGRVHRLVIDLDKGEYYAEVTDNTYYLPRERETEESRLIDAERALVEKEEETKRAKAEAESDPFGTGAGKYSMSKYQPKEWKPKRPKWQPFRESAIRPVKIKNAKVTSVYTPRLLDPMTTGKAYVYFFPLGFTEAAWLHVGNPKGEEGSFFTLALHPLTGMVRVYDQFVQAPVQRQVDDVGNEVDR